MTQPSMRRKKRRPIIRDYPVAPHPQPPVELKEIPGNWTNQDFTEPPQFPLLKIAAIIALLAFAVFLAYQLEH